MLVLERKPEIPASTPDEDLRDPLVGPQGRGDLWVTVKSMQGNQMYLEWTGTSGSFGVVARPLEFLSTFKW